MTAPAGRHGSSACERVWALLAAVLGFLADPCWLANDAVRHGATSGTLAAVSSGHGASKVRALASTGASPRWAQDMARWYPRSVGALPPQAELGRKLNSSQRGISARGGGPSWDEPERRAGTGCDQEAALVASPRRHDGGQSAARTADDRRSRLWLSSVREHHGTPPDGLNTGQLWPIHLCASKVPGEWNAVADGGPMRSSALTSPGLIALQKRGQHQDISCTRRKAGSHSGTLTQCIRPRPLQNHRTAAQRWGQRGSPAGVAGLPRRCSGRECH
jgi:hypothetical protein